MANPSADRASDSPTVLRNARLADGRLVDISLGDGRIAAVTEASPAPAASGVPAPDGGLDLGGWLVLPAMVEPHAHLDKALTAEAAPNPTGDLHGAMLARVLPYSNLVIVGNWFLPFGGFMAGLAGCSRT